MIREIKFGEAAEEWIAWAKANRTEKYWKRLERILREDVLPVIGDFPIWECLEISIQSTLTFTFRDDKRASAAYDAVCVVYRWKLKHP